MIHAHSHWHDRAIGFAYVSPQHVDESLAEIDRCVAGGPFERPVRLAGAAGLF
ncbi:MAG: hypothetical protein AB7U20_18415 [Planctomycetaceae bacterium]